MRGKLYVHGPPTGQHFSWAEHQLDEYAALMAACGIEGILLCTDSDNIVKTWPEWNGGPYEGMSIIQALAEWGLHTVARINNWENGRLFTDMHTASLLAQQLEPYNMEAIITVGNEPRLEKWKGQRPPHDWREKYNTWFYESAPVIQAQGCTPGYASAPNEMHSPYSMATDSQRQAWVDGDYIYTGHFYPHSTPPDFYWIDWVNTGEPMTAEEYDEILGPLKDYAPWNEWSLERINQSRKALAGNPNSIWEITVFWKEWMRHLEWMEEAFGQTVRMCATEGGWTPGAHTDPRMPPITPNQVADYTYYVAKQADDPLEFKAMWIWITELLEPGLGWPNDAWLTNNELFIEQYSQWEPGMPEILRYAMPVIWKLITEDCPWWTVHNLVNQLLELVKED